MESNDLLLEQIYETYAVRVRNYLTGKLHDPVAADDLCSEVFAKVCEKIDTYDEHKAALSTWIFTIANNKLVDYYRRNKYRNTTEEIPETIASSENIEGDICREESLDELAAALEQLDEKERDVVIQHYYRGRSLKDVAVSLQISYSYVKVIHKSALSHLRESMAS